MAPPSPPLRPNDPEPDPVEAAEEEETLTLLVLAGVGVSSTSLDRVRALVTSFVSTAGRQQQRQQQGSAAASHPDLIVALGPFVVGGGEEEEEEEGALADDAAAAVAAAAAAAPSPLPPWQAAPLDRRTVEGRAAAGEPRAIAAMSITHIYFSAYTYMHASMTPTHTEADATAALALLETVVCRLVYLTAAGVDPPSTTALSSQRPPPQLTPTSLNTHAAIVQLLPGLFVGGFAHAAHAAGEEGEGEGGGGPLLDDDEGQRPRQEQEQQQQQQQHPCTAASERATARALRAVGRLVGRKGEQQQQQQQLIMLETFPAPLPAEGDIAGAGGGDDSGGGGSSGGPFSLSPAFLATAAAAAGMDGGGGVDQGEGEEGRCRLLLHVRGGG